MKPNDTIILSVTEWKKQVMEFKKQLFVVQVFHV